RSVRALISLRPSSRSLRFAASMSPPASVRAFLQSIIGSDVSSRSCFTNAAVISAIAHLLLLYSKYVSRRDAETRSNGRRESVRISAILPLRLRASARDLLEFDLAEGN